MTDIQTTIWTETDFRISVDEWDEGGVWLSMRNDSASIYTALTRKEAEQMLKGLQDILAKEVTA
jgi:hypothetical protein